MSADDKDYKDIEILVGRAFGAEGTVEHEYASNQPVQSKVFRPNHYTKYTIDPITFIMLNNLPFDVGNVIKYVCRFEDKDGIQDLKKARRYLEMMIEVRENRKEYLPEKGCL